MRGDDQLQSGMFSYVSLEERIPKEHPLRNTRKCVDEVLQAMSKDFDGLYAKTGRPSIAPERLLRGLLLQIFYTVRSERMLIEQLEYNLLFRWFVGMEMDEPVWNHAVFSKNRERLLNQEVAQVFFRVCWRGPSRVCPMSISRSTARSWKRGRVRRAFRRRMAAIVTARSFPASGAATTRISRRPIQRLSCIARVTDKKPSWGF